MTQTVLAIGETTIRQIDGLFSLNDLHRAAGGDKNQQPANFMRLDTTQALIAEIQSSDMRTAAKSINGGPKRGTYACRELVIAYAAWISPAFHLTVLRVFLNTVAPAPTLQKSNLGRSLCEEIHRAAAEAVAAELPKLTAPPYSLKNIWAHLNAGNGVFIDSDTLAAIANDCNAKLASRVVFYQQRALALNR
jgi:hypothetical protein